MKDGVMVAEKIQLNKYQIMAWIFAIIAYVLDIMDWQLLAMAAPVVMKETGLSAKSFSLLLGAPLIGVGISGFFAGWIADRVGRVKTMVVCICWYSIFTLILPHVSSSFALMLLVRILAGIGLGAQWGVGNTLVAEWLPPTSRVKASATIQAGFCVGAIAAAYWVRLIIPLYGWQAIFYIAAIGFVFAFLAAVLLKDPPVWIEAKNILKNSKINENKMGNISMLFNQKLRKRTICSFLMLLGATLAYWASMSWVPTWLASERGLQIIKSMEYMIWLNVGGVLGFVLIGYISDRFGRKPPAYVAFIASAISLLIFVSIKNETVLKWFAPVYGFLVSPIFGVFGGYMSELYPTEVRATAVTGIYNTARLISFFGPAIVAWITAISSMTVAIGSMALLYALCLIPLHLLPETLER
ncbi:MAG: MFS transporter [Thermoanaerobacteraceae bacterium]|nr:MFS transporter [Thermoanaerobacteraceae bacterium]